MAAADGEEPSLSQEQIDEHVLECPDCREEVERLIAHPPLLPTIRRADSTEHIWPRLKPRLHEQAPGHSQIHPPKCTDVRPLSANAYRRRVAWSCAVACVLVTVVIGWWMIRPERSGGPPPSNTDNVGPLVLSISESALDDEPIDNSQSGQRAPFVDEAHADDIALAVVGEPLERDGKKLIRMKLFTVYKGRLPTGRFDADDQPVCHVECLMPQRLLDSRSKFLKPGARVALYLNHVPESGWSATSIRDLAGTEESWRKTVKRFCDVQMAAEVDDPAARYRELLAVDQPVLLDTAAYHALMYNPNIQALPMIRQHWQQSIARPLPPAGQLRPDGGGFGGGGMAGMGGGIVVDGVVHAAQSATVDAASPLPLAQILSQMHDAESVESVLRYGLKQQPGQRAGYIELLPDLCQNADADTIRMVRGELKKVIYVRQDAAGVLKESLDSAPQGEAPMNADLASEHDRIKAADDKLRRLLAKQAPEH
jgi:hypothetical protein